MPRCGFWCGAPCRWAVWPAVSSARRWACARRSLSRWQAACWPFCGSRSRRSARSGPSPTRQTGSRWSLRASVILGMDVSSSDVGYNVTDQKELYWAWALTPLPPPGSPAEVAFIRMRLIAPEAALRRAVVEFARLGGAMSTLAPAAPPLQDRLQVVLAGPAPQFERFMGEADPPGAAAGPTPLPPTTRSPPPAP